MEKTQHFNPEIIAEILNRNKKYQLVQCGGKQTGAECWRKYRRRRIIYLERDCAHTQCNASFFADSKVPTAADLDGGRLLGRQVIAGGLGQRRATKKIFCAHLLSWRIFFK